MPVQPRLTAFLSKTRIDDPQAPNAKEAGIWDRSGSDAPTRLAKSMAVTTSVLADMGRAVPSIWGHVRFFQEAWRDPRHENHAAASEYWRRFLCLIVLRSILPSSQRVTLQSIVLPAFPARSDSLVPATPRFRDAAAAHFPHELLGTPRGERVTLKAVTLGERVIGLLLPGILAVPGRRLLDRATLPLAINAIFPLERVNLDANEAPGFYRDYLTVQRLREIAGFLALAEEKFASGWGGAHGPESARGLLRGEVSNFNRVVKIGLGNTQSASWRLPEGARPPGSAEDALRLFDAGPSGRTQARRAALRLRPELASTNVANWQWILLSHTENADDYRAMGVADSRLIVDFLEQEPTEAERRALAGIDAVTARERVLLLSEDDIFEPVLIRLIVRSATTTLPGLLDGRFLIPIRPVVLALLGAEGIRAAVSLTPGPPANGEGDVEQVIVTIDLPLDGISSDGQVTIRMQRYYAVRDTTIQTAALPDALAVWPDFSAPEAPLPGRRQLPTLVYQASTKLAAGTREAAAIKPRALFSQQILVGMLESFLSDPAALGHPPVLPEPAKREGGSRNLEEDPRALHEQLYTRTHAEAIQFSTESAAGLFLIDRRKSPDQTLDGLNYTVAIDFGTSSTSIAFARNGVTEPAGMHPHVWMPFDEAILDDRRSAGETIDFLAPVVAAANNFVPPVARVDTPFPSVLLLRTKFREFEESPLLHARIPFVPGSNRATLADMIRNPPRDTLVEVNLKWELRSDRRKLIYHLLREAMLLALAHARGNAIEPSRVSWHLTMPQLLEPAKRDEFMHLAALALQTAMGGLYTDNGGLVDSRLAFAKENLQFHWESEAVYRYVLSRQQSVINPLMAVLDIGGHTTDIAIYSIGRLHCQGSIAFSGRAMLVDYWQEHWEGFVNLVRDVRGEPGYVIDVVEPNRYPTAAEFEPPAAAGPGRVGVPASTAESDYSNIRKTLIEIQLSDPRFNLAAYLGDVGGTHTNALLRATTQRVRFGYLALMYFLIHHCLAGVLAATARDASGQIRNEADQGLGVFLGGRGSQLFKLFCGSELPDVNLCQKWMGQIGALGAPVYVELTRQPKLEVVLGCLQNPRPIDTTEPSGGAARNSSAEEPQRAPWGGNALPGSFTAFCAEVSSVFGTDVTAINDAVALSTLRAQADTRLQLPAERPYAGGFDTRGEVPDVTRDRTLFVAQVQLFLQKWDLLAEGRFGLRDQVK